MKSVELKRLFRKIKEHSPAVEIPSSTPRELDVKHQAKILTLEAPADSVKVPRFEENPSPAHTQRDPEAADRPKPVDEAMAMDAATAFKKYDVSATGSMSYADVEAMMKDLDYDADINYCQGLMDAFAEFDSDADGSIESDEFAKLWGHLGGGDSSPKPAAADESDPLYKRFKQYDVNHNGKLAHYEVHQICVDLGYDADARYVQGVMDQFAKFDANADGQIEFVEFATLWEYLGGEERAAEAEKTLQVMPRPR